MILKIFHWRKTLITMTTQKMLFLFWLRMDFLMDFLVRSSLERKWPWGIEAHEARWQFSKIGRFSYRSGSAIHSSERSHLGQHIGDVPGARNKLVSSKPISLRQLRSKWDFKAKPLLVIRSRFLPLMKNQAVSSSRRYKHLPPYARMASLNLLSLCD